MKKTLKNIFLSISAFVLAFSIAVPNADAGFFSSIGKAVGSFYEEFEDVTPLGLFDGEFFGYELSDLDSNSGGGRVDNRTRYSTENACEQAEGKPCIEKNGAWVAATLEELKNAEEDEGPETPSEQFLWKPVSESDGKLVVLLPSSYRGQVVSVAIVQKGEVLEIGKFTGDEKNGLRPHYRFSKPGSAYGGGLEVHVSMLNGTWIFPIGNGANRVEGIQPRLAVEEEFSNFFESAFTDLPPYQQISENSPEVTCEVSDTTIMIGETVTYTAKTKGGNEPFDSFTWSDDSAANSPEFSIAPNQAGEFYMDVLVRDAFGIMALDVCPKVTILDENGDEVSNSTFSFDSGFTNFADYLTATVVENDLEVECKVSDRKIEPGDSVKISVEIDGGESPYDIEWDGDINDIDDFDDNDRSQTVRIDEEGRYEIEVFVEDDDGNKANDSCPIIKVGDVTDNVTVTSQTNNSGSGLSIAQIIQIMINSGMITAEKGNQVLQNLAGGSTGATSPSNSGGTSTTATPTESLVCTDIKADVYFGEQTLNVSRLQSFLIAKGYLVMPAGVSKGYYGDLTKSAVIRYMNSTGVSVSGDVANTQVRDSIRSASCGA